MAVDNVRCKLDEPTPHLSRLRSPRSKCSIPVHTPKQRARLLGDKPGRVLMPRSRASVPRHCRSYDEPINAEKPRITRS
jgi:hypothetical protein